MPTGPGWMRESCPYGERGRGAGIPPRSGSAAGGVQVGCSEIARWGPGSWMDAIGETAEESGTDGLGRPPAAARPWSRCAGQGSRGRLWRAGSRPTRLSPGRSGPARAARRSARSATPSPAPSRPAAAAASRAGNRRGAPGAPPSRGSPPAAAARVAPAAARAGIARGSR